MIKIQALKKELHELANFVVKENHVHHVSESYNEALFYPEIMSLFEEDLMLFDNSRIFIAQEDSEIVGSVKVTLWDEINKLPIEKLFNLKVKEVLALDENIHICMWAGSQSK